MSLAEMLTEQVEILHHSTSGVDVYGNPEPVWVADPVVRGKLSQVDRSEDSADRETQVARWKLVLPPGTVIDGRDRVVTQYGTMRVDGPVYRPRTPAGEHHVRVFLRLAED